MINYYGRTLSPIWDTANYISFINLKSLVLDVKKLIDLSVNSKVVIAIHLMCLFTNRPIFKLIIILVIFYSHFKMVLLYYLRSIGISIVSVINTLKKSYFNLLYGLEWHINVVVVDKNVKWLIHVTIKWPIDLNMWL